MDREVTPGACASGQKGNMRYPDTRMKVGRAK